MGNSSGITDANGNGLQTDIAASAPASIDFSEDSLDAIVSLETVLTWVCPQVERIKISSENLIIESNVLITYIDADCEAGTVTSAGMQMLDDSGATMSTSITCAEDSCTWSWAEAVEPVEGAERRRLGVDTASTLQGLKN